HAPSHLLTSAAGAIWIAHDKEGLVERIDGATKQSAATIETGTTDMESDGDITAGNGYVWMINRGSTVVQIDPRTNAVKGVFRPPVGTLMGRRVRFGGGALWISGPSIFRIKAPS